MMSADHPGLTFDGCVMCMHPDKRMIPMEKKSAIFCSEYGKQIFIRLYSRLRDVSPGSSIANKVEIGYYVNG
jgi:hypothetical protein